MLLSAREMIFIVCCIWVQDRLHVKAENIMLRKTSRLSSTFKWKSGGKDYYYHSYYANDGSKISWPARSGFQPGPFWQGDLQGFYTVHNITITSDDHTEFASEIRDAYIGVSSVDIKCPDDDVTWCGQWPTGTLPKKTLTFSCSHVQPVRFVRVWRNITGYLTVQEVEVEGTPKRTRAAKYNKSLNKKLHTPQTSVYAMSATDCGFKCYKTQPCLGFSYNPSADPSCLLATSTKTTTATDWVTYSITDCSNHITCDLTDQFK
ncbi:uncharacterized protein [Haliotis cracherodii]|uniref:uncharacterized protein n=1 Tax=Haliotis cracherodii TaxID=6455 RepID=UPI0039E96DD9